MRTFCMSIANVRLDVHYDDVDVQVFVSKTTDALGTTTTDIFDLIYANKAVMSSIYSAIEENKKLHGGGLCV